MKKPGSRKTQWVAATWEVHGVLSMHLRLFDSRKTDTKFMTHNYELP